MIRGPSKALDRRDFCLAICHDDVGIKHGHDHRANDRDEHCKRVLTEIGMSLEQFSWRESLTHEKCRERDDDRIDRREHQKSFLGACREQECLRDQSKEGHCSQP